MNRFAFLKSIKKTHEEVEGIILIIHIPTSIWSIQIVRVKDFVC